ncbi:putative galactinol-sucrose galactosyltransferase 2-like, partial [Trifolium medium]|nr:putative galactinol-sucrose galactosyltransferase 2-like [Trifolium medium]
VSPPCPSGPDDAVLVSKKDVTNDFSKSDGGKEPGEPMPQNSCIFNFRRKRMGSSYLRASPKSYLASCGVHGVKVDVQNLIETLGSGYGGRVSLTKR